MRAVLDALRRSRRQQTCFEEAGRSFLVECYDRIIDSGRGIKEILRAGSFWSRLFRRSRLRIGPQGTQDQLAALQRAFDRRQFLERGFDEFRQQHPVRGDGVRPDGDTFVTACLLACGDTRHQSNAYRWFQAEPITLDVFQPFHLHQSCQGTDKVRNGLYTLQRLLGRSFCLAFDQLEETGTDSEAAARFAQLFGVLLRNLCAMPGFCLLFACQQSFWQSFAQSAPPMLVQRMVEGDGAQLLSPLDDETAEELVRERLRAADIWRRLALDGLPPDQPCYPFTAQQIRQMRIDTGGELRAFLLRAQRDFRQRLTASPPPSRPPSPRPRIRLTGIEPLEVMSHPPSPVRIRGENLPAEVRVLFAGHLAPQIVCRPEVGEITATTPAGLLGDIEVRVEAVDDSSNGADLSLTFLSRGVPRPYRDHIDGQLLKARRKELGWTQQQVADLIKSKQTYISNLELGKWKKPPDEMYARLADLYQRPLSSFLRQNERQG
jgi:hypothetical protein